MPFGHLTSRKYAQITSWKGFPGQPGSMFTEGRGGLLTIVGKTLDAVINERDGESCPDQLFIPTMSEDAPVHPITVTIPFEDAEVPHEVSHNFFPDIDVHANRLVGTTVKLLLLAHHGEHWDEHKWCSIPLPESEFALNEWPWPDGDDVYLVLTRSRPRSEVWERLGIALVDYWSPDRQASVSLE